MAGSADRPAGVFRATTGTLEVLAAGPGRIDARFRLDARGFLASAPQIETGTVAVTGWFTAESGAVAVSAADHPVRRLP